MAGPKTRKRIGSIFHLPILIQHDPFILAIETLHYDVYLYLHNKTQQPMTKNNDLGAPANAHVWAKMKWIVSEGRTGVVVLQVGHLASHKRPAGLETWCCNLTPVQQKPRVQSAVQNLKVVRTSIRNETGPCRRVWFVWAVVVVVCSELLLLLLLLLLYILRCVSRSCCCCGYSQNSSSIGNHEQHSQL
jgi:hypothetical protein